MPTHSPLTILIIGATGDIGEVTHAALCPRHNIITAGRTTGDIRVDMTDHVSTRAMYAAAGPVDALVVIAGEVHFGPLHQTTAKDVAQSLQQKAMGQINLVLAGLDHLTPGGSFTLTTGILNRDPIRQGACAAAANGALDGFVKAAALDMPHGLRINAVSPGLLKVSATRYGAWFPGHLPVPSDRVAAAYLRSVEGPQTGQIFTVD